MLGKTICTCAVAVASLFLMPLELFCQPSCEEAQLLYHQARQEYWSKPEASVEKLEKALELCPRYFEFREELGRELYGLGRSDRALQVVDDALSLAPGEASLHYLKGEILRDQGYLMDALDASMLARQHGDDRAQSLFKGILRLIDKDRKQRGLKPLGHVIIVGPGETYTAEQVKGMLNRKALDRPRIYFQNIQFDLSKSTLKRESMRQLQEIAGGIRLAMDRDGKIPEKVYLVGHCDRNPYRHVSPTESDRLNRKLSLDRASAVKAYVAQKLHGILDSHALVAEGRGFDEPLDLGQNVKADARNRRVEFSIVLRGE